MPRTHTRRALAREAQTRHALERARRHVTTRAPRAVPTKASTRKRARPDVHTLDMHIQAVRTQAAHTHKQAAHTHTPHHTCRAHTRRALTRQAHTRHAYTSLGSKCNASVNANPDPNPNAKPNPNLDLTQVFRVMVCLWTTSDADGVFEQRHCLAAHASSQVPSAASNVIDSMTSPLAVHLMYNGVKHYTGFTPALKLVPKPPRHARRNARRRAGRAAMHGRSSRKLTISASLRAHSRTVR